MRNTILRCRCVDVNVTVVRRLCLPVIASVVFAVSSWPPVLPSSRPHSQPRLRLRSALIWQGKRQCLRQCQLKRRRCVHFSFIIPSQQYLRVELFNIKLYCCSRNLISLQAAPPPPPGPPPVLAADDGRHGHDVITENCQLIFQRHQPCEWSGNWAALRI